MNMVIVVGGAYCFLSLRNTLLDCIPSTYSESFTRAELWQAVVYSTCSPCDNAAQESGDHWVCVVVETKKHALCASMTRFHSVSAQFQTCIRGVRTQGAQANISTYCFISLFGLWSWTPTVPSYSSPSCATLQTKTQGLTPSLEQRD